jgi:phage terminase large subunit-like protein
MGPAVARVARALGTPLMPWQQYAADVGGEVDERGRFVYSLVIVTVPRQSGKTTLMLAQSVQRCLMRDRARAWHTAQTGQHARKKWRELAEAVTTSPLRELVAGTPRKAAGSEALVFVNGSELRPHPPTRDSLHGEQGDHNDIDEAWAYDEIQGADVMQAIRPTHATRPGAQTWVYSTRGDRSSTWFHGLIEQGYAGLPGVALFDFGIPTAPTRPTST